jgi:tetratricopeptide (TPR) repeat protein
MELKLKTISQSGISEALSKATLYRYLNEPEEAESICHDILAIEPGHQVALRTLGLAITDQFIGQAWDRFAEAESVFCQLTDPYERDYYMGLLHERRAKAQMRAGRPAHILAGLFKEAMRHFEAAEKIHPPDNDDAVLRWNRCVRLLEELPHTEEKQGAVTFEDHDSAPIPIRRRARAGK